jgi:hypothetical protein
MSSDAGDAKKKSAPWAVIVVVLALMGAAAGVIGNLGGARDALCRLGPLETRCAQYGLAPAFDWHGPKAALLARVSGVWGNVAESGKSACTTAVSYVVFPRGDGDFFIIVRGTDGYESEGHVARVSEGSVFIRTLTPAGEAGRQWALRPEADRLIRVDNNGAATRLVRCDWPPDVPFDSELAQ